MKSWLAKTECPQCHYCRQIIFLLFFVVAIITQIVDALLLPLLPCSRSRLLTDGLESGMKSWGIPRRFSPFIPKGTLCSLLSLFSSYPLEYLLPLNLAWIPGHFFLRADPFRASKGVHPCVCMRPPTQKLLLLTEMLKRISMKTLPRRGRHLLFALLWSPNLSCQSSDCVCVAVQ